jgi:hypothetical protein
MSWPDSFPILTKDDILLSEAEYEDKDGRKTTVGWLKEIFLYEKVDDDHLWITDESRRIFSEVLDTFCRLVIIKKDEIHRWEEQTPAKTQAAALNKLRKDLGYTVIVED